MEILKEWASLEGRYNRRKYFFYTCGIGILFSIFLLVVTILLNTFDLYFDKVAELNGVERGFGLFNIIQIITLALMFLISLFVIWITQVSFQVKRLHDLNKTGWMWFIFLVPLAGLFLAIYLLFWKGTEGANQYGADPLAKK